jgi:hypothetical protein
MIACRSRALDASASRRHPESSETDASPDEDADGLCRGRAAGLRFSGIPLPQAGILDVSRPSLPATVARPSSDPAHPRQDQSDHCSAAIACRNPLGQSWRKSTGRCAAGAPTFGWATRRASLLRLMTTSANDWRCSWARRPDDMADIRSGTPTRTSNDSGCIAWLEPSSGT